MTVAIEAEAIDSAVVDLASPDTTLKRVVYLLGAGATQGCISHSGSPRNLLMSGLAGPIAGHLQEKVYEKYEDHEGIRRLVNDVVTSEPILDIEQLITFLEDSPAGDYQEFADVLRVVFSSVLRRLLDDVEGELGDSRSVLYGALVDMHAVAGHGEVLQGFMTLNYDVFLEHAIVNDLGRRVDYGVAMNPIGDGEPAVRVLKMHGSFGWSHTWPVDAELRHSPGLWIPPGIRKPKSDYPFNVIWGRARELLDCDVLRIIGCNLGPNDWDLVSLLFSTRHTHASASPYTVEVISDFDTAKRIRRLFPFLEVRWLGDLPRIGEQMVGEMLGSSPRRFSELSADLQRRVVDNSRKTITNPFSYWLTQMAEMLVTDLGDVSTETGAFEKFVEAMV